MQKKSIILLITLFFIITISTIILKNIEDTEKFLDNIARDDSLSQMQITINNIKDEVSKFLRKNKNDIDDILQYSSFVPFKIKNIDIVLKITDYKASPLPINELNGSVILQPIFLENINYQYDFLELVNKNKKKYGNYINNAQIKQTIDDYIKLTKDRNILKIEDKFTYLNNTAKMRLIKCDYEIKINNLNCKASLIFDLNSSLVKDFNILSIF
jgi:hypothetical protein